MTSRFVLLDSPTGEAHPGSLDTIPQHTEESASPMETLEAWRRWRAWLKVQGSGSPETGRVYGRAVLAFLAETDCPPLLEIDETHLVAFLDIFAPKGAARHQYLKALRSWCGW